VALGDGDVLAQDVGSTPHRQRQLRHLVHFLAVAQEEHFHRAAERLHMTQSALSRRIQRLELELGVCLFDRSRQGATLTPAGRELKHHALRLLAGLDRSVQRIHATRRAEGRCLRVAIIAAAIQSQQVALGLRRFSESNPDAELEIVSMLTDEQLQALEEERLDAGFLFDFDDDYLGGRFETKLIATDPVMAMMSPSHRLAERSELHILDLAGEGLVWPTGSAGPLRFNGRLEAAFTRAGVTPRIAVLGTSAEMMISAAAARLGIGLLSSRKTSEDVVFRPIVGLSCALRVLLAWRRGDGNALAARLAEAITD
jgi:DNA-binding transcriptional LysR family regulator